MAYTKLPINPKTAQEVAAMVKQRWGWLQRDPGPGANDSNNWIVGGIAQMTIGQWLGNLWGCPVPQLQFDHHDKHDWRLAGFDIDIKSSYAPSLAVTGTVNRYAWGLFIPEGQWQHHQHDIYIAAARATQDWQYMEHVWVLGWCAKELVTLVTPVSAHPVSGKPLRGPARIIPLIDMSSPTELRLLVEHKTKPAEQMVLPLA